MREIDQLFCDGTPLDVDLGDGGEPLHVVYNRERLPSDWLLQDHSEDQALAFTKALVCMVLIKWDILRAGEPVPFDDPHVPHGVYRRIYDAILKDIMPDPFGRSKRRDSSSTRGSAATASTS